MNYVVIGWTAFQLGFVIAFLWRGYLEKKRCPVHSSLFVDDEEKPKGEGNAEGVS